MRTRFVRTCRVVIDAIVESVSHLIHSLTHARTSTSVKSTTMNAWRPSAATTQSGATDVSERKAAAQDIRLMRKRKIAKVKTQFTLQFSPLKSSFRFFITLEQMTTNVLSVVIIASILTSATTLRVSPLGRFKQEFLSATVLFTTQKHFQILNQGHF